VPLDNIKCIQQYERNKVLSTRNAFSLIYSRYGLSGICRGYAITFTRDVWGYGFYFLPYQLLKDFGIKRNITNPVYYILIGGLSGKFRFSS